MLVQYRCATILGSGAIWNFMELATPKFTKEFIASVSKTYTENCLGCEHLRVIAETKTNLCVINEKPCKVDVLSPALTNPACKFARKSYSPDGTIPDFKADLLRKGPEMP